MGEERSLAVPVLVGPVLLAVVLLCLVPLALLFAYSFFHVDSVTIVKSPGLGNYARILTSETYRSLILGALVRGIEIALITAVIGYPISFFIAKRVRHLKSAFLTALLVPLYTGDLVRIFAWRVVLGTEGVLNSFLIWSGIIHEPIQVLLFSPTATTIVLAYNYLPFMVFGLWLSFESLDERLLEVAADLGAGPIVTFLRVVFPLTAPGLLSGGLMVFALTVGDYLTPQLIGGSSGVTVISAINDLFGTAFDWPLGSAIAWTLLAAVFATVAIVLIGTSRSRWNRSLASEA